MEKLKSEIGQLAARFSESWKCSDRSTLSFSKLALQHLNSFPEVSPPTLESLKDILPSLNLPIQTFPHNEFSDFPITLYRDEDFCIDMYYWLSGDTCIHNHYFSGAFKVLQGRSFQLSYKFEMEHELCPFIQTGKLIKLEEKHIHPSETQAITHFDSFIHDVIHLEMPTVTLCLRSPPVTDKHLAMFLHGGMKIISTPPSMNLLKWLKVTALTPYDSLASEIPFSHYDLIKLHTQIISGQIALSEKLQELIVSYLRRSEVGDDYLNKVSANEKIRTKIKKMVLAGSHS